MSEKENKTLCLIDKKNWNSYIQINISYGFKSGFRLALDFRNRSTVWSHFVKIGADAVIASPSDNLILNDSVVKFS